MNWNYTPPTFDIPQQGQHCARIASVDETLSKIKSLPMLKISLAILNSSFSIFHYLVFDNSSPRSVNLSNFYYHKFAKAFNLTLGDFNLANWINHVGGIVIVHDDFNGHIVPKIKSFFTPNNTALNNQGFNPQPFNPDQLTNFS